MSKPALLMLIFTILVFISWDESLAWAAERRVNYPVDFSSPLIDAFDAIERCMSKDSVLSAVQKFGVVLREFSPLNPPPFVRGWEFGKSRHLVAILRGEDVLSEGVEPQAILQVDLDSLGRATRVIFGFIYAPGHRPGSTLRVYNQRIRDWADPISGCGR